MALHRACRQAVRSAGGRPVPRQNYHLTLLYLGAVADEALAALCAAAARLPLPSLELRLTRFGYFTAGRAFWIGPAEPQPALSALAMALRAIAAELGLATDRREFQPHLTLCRNVLQPPQLDPLQPLSWPVHGFVLCESISSPGGLRYLPLKHFPPGSCPEP